MDVRVNRETVNDAAKLMMHRLIARELGRDPSLLDRAKLSQARIAERFAGRPFVREWDELLSAPAAKLRARLTSRDPGMVRLRSSSPFAVAEGVDFTDYHLRLRIQRAAGRVVARGLACKSRRPTMMAM
jgi:hypothetical protein